MRSEAKACSQLALMTGRSRERRGVRVGRSVEEVAWPVGSRDGEQGGCEQDRLVAVVLDEPPILLLLFLDPSLREHVADDGTVVGAIETLCSHPLNHGEGCGAYLCLCKAGGYYVVGQTSFVDALGLEVPVSLVAVLVVELVALRIGSSNALATHDVARARALVKVAIRLLGVERKSARLGAGDLCWLEHGAALEARGDLRSGWCASAELRAQYGRSICLAGKSAAACLSGGVTVRLSVNADVERWWCRQQQEEGAHGQIKVPTRVGAPRSRRAGAAAACALEVALAQPPTNVKNFALAQIDLPFRNARTTAKQPSLLSLLSPPFD
ncbi:hypothetical protein L1887_47069 [Cichorium endivia]|nr:hypothetical protein L1887_47069 [Cichorium endivia]